MKDIFIVPLITFNIIIILLLNKYKNSKTGSVIGFCWFVLVIGIFFLFFKKSATWYLGVGAPNPSGTLLIF